MPHFVLALHREIEARDAVAPAPDLLQIHSGTEGPAGTRHDDGADLGIGFEGDERGPDREPQLGVERVHLFGPVQGHDRDLGLALDSKDGFGRHGSVSSSMRYAS